MIKKIPFFPILLILVGVAFLVETLGGVNVSYLWPVLLMVYGAIKIINGFLVSN
jgi:hypothetical protein